MSPDQRLPPATEGQVVQQAPHDQPQVRFGLLVSAHVVGRESRATRALHGENRTDVVKNVAEKMLRA